MIYELRIKTDKKVIYEHWYGLIESLNRMTEIGSCNNVEMIDCICGATGEVMATIEYGEITYTALEIISRFNEEIGVA